MDSFSRLRRDNVSVLFEPREFLSLALGVLFGTGEGPWVHSLVLVVRKAFSFGESA